MQSESLLTRTKKLLASHDLRARKGLGQNFLVDGSILKKITAAAELTPADTVIEVGPGLGVLTETLVEQAGKVITIELDSNLADILKSTFFRLKQNYSNQRRRFKSQSMRTYWGNRPITRWWQIYPTILHRR